MGGKEVVLTYEGLRNLEKELEMLKSVRRREVAEKIRRALSFGDISENSEYDEAKNEQAMVESRIIKLEEMLNNAKVLDEDEIDTTKISIGTKVRLLDMEFNEESDYYIVGSTEANPLENKISDESPMGKALINKKVGDEVVVEAPKGNFTYKVIEIYIS